MRRAQKVESVRTLEQEFGRATVAVLAEYRGLTAGQMNRLRRAVREADGRCRVAKHTLARRALGDGPYAGLKPLLSGPVAVILGFRDPVAVAKVTRKLADEMPKLEIRGAVLDGQVLTAPAVKALAQLLGLLQAPAQRLLRTLNEPAARLARLVAAVAERAGGPA